MCVIYVHGLLPFVHVWNRRTMIVTVGSCVDQSIRIVTVGSCVEQSIRIVTVGHVWNRRKMIVTVGSCVEQTDNYCYSWFMGETDGQLLLQLLHV